MEITEYLDNSTWEKGNYDLGCVYEKTFKDAAFIKPKQTVEEITVSVIVYPIIDKESLVEISYNHNTIFKNTIFKGWLKNAAELEDVFGYIKLFENGYTER